MIRSKHKNGINKNDVGRNGNNRGADIRHK